MILQHDVHLGKISIYLETTLRKKHCENLTDDGRNAGHQYFSFLPTNFLPFQRKTEEMLDINIFFLFAHKFSNLSKKTKKGKNRI